MTSKHLVWARPALVMAGVTLLAYLGLIPAGWFAAPADKVAHAVLYGWLAGCMAHVLAGERRHWALAGPLLVAIADEVTQTFSRRRSPDVWDLAADAVGIVMAYAWVVSRANRAASAQ